MFGIGIPELILILIVGLIVFGPSKLPEIGRAVGKGLREFRKASNALQSAINATEEPASSRAASAPSERPSQSPTPAEKTATAKETVPADTPPKDAVTEAVPPNPESRGYEPPTQESVRAQLEQKKG